MRYRFLQDNSPEKGSCKYGWTTRNKFNDTQNSGTSQMTCLNALTAKTSVFYDDVNSNRNSLRSSRLGSIRAASTKRTGLRVKLVTTNAASLYKVNPCLHIKDEVRLEDAISFSCRTLGYTNSGKYPLEVRQVLCNVPGLMTGLMGYNQSQMNSLGATLLSTPTISGGPHTGPIDWVALYSRYDERVNSFLSSDLLLGETLGQPDIFLDTLKFLVSPRKGLTNLVKFALSELGGRARSRSFGSIARTLTKRSANANLFYQFGLKPAVEDLKSIFEAHDKVSKKMDFLARNRNAFVPVRVGVPSLSAPDSTDIVSDFNHSIKSKTGRLAESATIGCLARVRPDVAPSDSWKAYLQYFGIGKLLQLTWEFVPFSFVVDWVTNTQERINEMSRFGIGGPFSEFRNFCCSHKTETFTDHFYVPGWISVWGMTAEAQAPTHIASTRHSVYQRFLSLPHDSTLFDTSGLGLFHLLTGGSLLVQKIVK